MFTARFLTMPAIALTVIVGLAQAHSGAAQSPSEVRTVYRAVNCATAATGTDATCTLAGDATASMVR